MFLYIAFLCSGILIAAISGLYYRLLCTISSCFDMEFSLLVTFDVQDFTVTYEEDGTITVTCTFVRGSNAQGCLVKFRNLNGLVERNITLPRQRSVPEDTQPTSSDTLNDLPGGEYEVVALDMESDGSVATNYGPLKGVYTFPPPTSAPSPPDASPTTICE